MSSDSEGARAADAQALPQYSVQLANAYMYEAELKRLGRPESAPDQPSLDVSVIGHQIDASAHEIHVVIQAKVDFPFQEGAALAQVTCSVLGQFRSHAQLEPLFAEAFAQREAVLLLYPYLRSAVGELARMSFLEFPPLPTIDVLAMIAQGAATETSVPPPVKRRRHRKEPNRES